MYTHLFRNMTFSLRAGIELQNRNRCEPEPVEPSANRNRCEPEPLRTRTGVNRPSSQNSCELELLRTGAGVNRNRWEPEPEPKSLRWFACYNYLIRSLGKSFFKAYNNAYIYIYVYVKRSFVVGQHRESWSVEYSIDYIRRACRNAHHEYRKYLFAVMWKRCSIMGFNYSQIMCSLNQCLICSLNLCAISSLNVNSIHPFENNAFTYSLKTMFSYVFLDSSKKYALCVG